MGMSASKKARRKAEREGKLNPEALRGEWTRKPRTQVQPNTKLEQRRSFCRKPGTSEGADFFAGLRSDHRTAAAFSGAMPLFKTASTSKACASSAQSACGLRPA